jgi:Na+/melibiose symporter-like transporter
MTGTGSKPKLYQLFFYGLPSIALAFPLIPFAVYLPEYYANDLGLGFLNVGIALFIYRLFDVISDPVAGFVSDRYSMFGSNRKIWMCLGGLVAGFALNQLATASEDVSVQYLGIWSAILYVGWTFIMIPYLALGADIADGYEAKTSFTSVREACSLIGMLTALSMPFFIEGPIIQSIPVYILPFGALSLLGLIIFVPERLKGKAKNVDRKSSFQCFRAVVTEPLMKKLLTVWFLTSTASAVPSVLFPVYVSTVLEGGERTENLAIFIYFAAAVLGMPFWNRLSKGRYKHQIMRISIIIVCLAFPVAAILPAGAVYWFYGVCIITGFALAAELVLAPSMLADIACLNHQKSSEDHTAIHFACWGVVSKLALAFAILFAFGLIEFAKGFFENATYAFVVGGLYAGLPVILKIPTIFLLKRFPFGKKERDLIDSF